MTYISVDIDVDIWEVWGDMSGIEKEKFRAYIQEESRGDDDGPLSTLTYEIEYLGLHSELNALDVLRELAKRLETV